MGIIQLFNSKNFGSLMHLILLTVSVKNVVLNTKWIILYIKKL